MNLFRIGKHVDDGSVNGVLILHPRSPSCEQDDLLFLYIFVKSLRNGWLSTSFAMNHHFQWVIYTSMRLGSTVSRFSVRVPVLSLHSTSIPAISSIAVILFVIAPFFWDISPNILISEELNILSRYTWSKSVPAEKVCESQWQEWQTKPWAWRLECLRSRGREGCWSHLCMNGVAPETSRWSRESFPRRSSRYRNSQWR